jgi:hypothetical protein
MALAFVGTPASGTFAGGSSKTVSYTLAAGANRILLVGVSGNGSGVSVSSVTYNGVSLTGRTGASDGNRFARWFTLPETSLPADGAYNVVATLSGNGYGSVYITCLSGCPGGAPEASANNTGSTTVTTNITTLTNDARLFDLTGCDDRTFTPGAGQTELYDAKDGAAAASQVSWKDVAVAGAASMSETSVPGGSHAMSVISIPSVGGGGQVIWL